MKQYETYKDSGVAWIGKVPKHWKIGKFKYCGSFTKGKLPNEINTEYDGAPIIGASEMLGKEIRNFTKDTTVPTCGPSDILILWDGANAGIVASNLEGVVSSTASKYTLTDNRLNNRYVCLLFKSLEPYFKDKVGGTTIPHMSMDFINDNPLLMPSLEEQEKIAEYLDYKVGQIDALLAEKEAQVADMQKYRQSLISETVTRGLNPDVTLKESGIVWIGNIPEHWGIGKTANLFNGIGSGTTPDTNNLVYYDDKGISWLQTGDLTDGIVNETSKRISQKALDDNSALRIYPKGSLVIAMYGATIGKVGILNFNAATNQACCVLPSSTQMSMQYSFYVYIASKSHLVYQASGGGQPNISQAIIKSHRLPVPPLAEQEQIAAYLDEKTAQIADILTDLQQQIADLKAYKSSLISEAVTGKIDLRTWAKPQNE